MYLSNFTKDKTQYYNFTKDKITKHTKDKIYKIKFKEDKGNFIFFSFLFLISYFFLFFLVLSYSFFYLYLYLFLFCFIAYFYPIFFIKKHISNLTNMLYIFIVYLFLFVFIYSFYLTSLASTTCLNVESSLHVDKDISTFPSVSLDTYDVSLGFLVATS